MPDEWYCQIEGNLIGPLAARDLLRLAKSGKLTPADMVRKTASGKWLSAGTVRGLTFNAPAMAAPSRKTKKLCAVTGAVIEASYSRWWITIKIQLVCAAVAWSAVAIAIIIKASFGDQAWQGDQGFIATACLLVAIFFCPVAAILAMIADAIFFFVLLYRLWQVVQDGNARTTPEQAVGYAFIPLFNFYWMFIATEGLAVEINRVAADRGIEAPPASASCMATFCLLVYLSYLALFVGFVFTIGDLADDPSQVLLWTGLFVGIFSLPALIFRFLAFRSAKRAAVFIAEA
jgi:hypothetical protein